MRRLALPGRPLSTHLLPTVWKLCCTFSTMWSMLKLDGRWLGGNFLDVTSAGRALNRDAPVPTTTPSSSALREGGDSPT